MSLLRLPITHNTAMYYHAQHLGCITDFDGVLQWSSCGLHLSVGVGVWDVGEVKPLALCSLSLCVAQGFGVLVIPTVGVVRLKALHC